MSIGFSLPYQKKSFDFEDLIPMDIFNSLAFFYK